MKIHTILQANYEDVHKSALKGKHQVFAENLKSTYRKTNALFLQAAAAKYPWGFSFDVSFRDYLRERVLKVHEADGSHGFVPPNSTRAPYKNTNEFSLVDLGQKIFGSAKLEGRCPVTQMHRARDGNTFTYKAYVDLPYRTVEEYRQAGLRFEGQSLYSVNTPEYARDDGDRAHGVIKYGWSEINHVTLDNRLNAWAPNATLFMIAHGSQCASREKVMKTAVRVLGTGRANSVEITVATPEIIKHLTHMLRPEKEFQVKLSEDGVRRYNAQIKILSTTEHMQLIDTAVRELYESSIIAPCV